MTNANLKQMDLWNVISTFFFTIVAVLLFSKPIAIGLFCGMTLMTLDLHFLRLLVHWFFNGTSTKKILATVAMATKLGFLLGAAWYLQKNIPMNSIAFGFGVVAVVFTTTMVFSFGLKAGTE